MIQKPIVLPPEWCTTEDPYNAPGKAWDAQPRRVDPGSSVQQGYVPGTKPPVTEFNYQLNAIGQWLKSYAASLVRNWFLMYSSDTSYEITALGHYPPTDEYLFGTPIARSLYTCRGYTYVEFSDVSFVVGTAEPVALMANNETDLMIVADSPGGNANVLTYPINLKYTFGNDAYTFSTGDLGYDPVSGFWILVGNDTASKATIWTSIDTGTTWVQRTTVVSNNYVDGLNSLAISSTGLMVAIEGQTTGTDSFTSLDGVTWTKHDDLGFNSGAKVRYDPVTGYFIIVCEGAAPETYTSPNATTWTKVANWSSFGTSWQVTDLQVVGGAWVVVAWNVSPNNSFTFVSLDQGATWELVGETTGTEGSYQAYTFKNLGNNLTIGIGNGLVGTPFLRLVRNLI